MEHETISADKPLWLAMHIVDVELAAEQVDPQIPMRLVGTP
jgi:hypothetical protein